MIGAGGPALFGYCLDIFLYGILIVQTYLYYLAFPSDKRLTKGTVYSVFIVGTLQAAFSLRDFYTLFCTPDGNVWLENHDVHRFGFMWLNIPVSNSVVAIIVQSFYAHRIYTISGNKLITATISALALLQLLSGIVSAALVHKPASIHNIPPDNSDLRAYAPTIIYALGGAICNSIIAIFMCCSILSARARNASKETQVIVTRTKRLMFETGFMTAALSITYTAFTFFEVVNSWYLIPGLSLGKLYGVSMLVLLNNRFTILGGRNTSHPDFDIPSYRRSDITHTSTSSGVSRGIAFAHSRAAETTFASGGVHTVELTPQLERVSEESSQTGEKDRKQQEA